MEPVDDVSDVPARRESNRKKEIDILRGRKKQRENNT